MSNNGCYRRIHIHGNRRIPPNVSNFVSRLRPILNFGNSNFHAYRLRTWLEFPNPAASKRVNQIREPLIDRDSFS
jgi:hypothetical protein